MTCTSYEFQNTKWQINKYSSRASSAQPDLRFPKRCFNQTSTSFVRATGDTVVARDRTQIERRIYKSRIVITRGDDDSP